MRRGGKNRRQMPQGSKLELRSDLVDMMAVVKKCYLCGNTEFNKRPGSARDKPEIIGFLV